MSLAEHTKKPGTLIPAWHLMTSLSTSCQFLSTMFRCSCVSCHSLWPWFTLGKLEKHPAEYINLQPGTLLDLRLTECKRVSPQYTWWPGYSPLCQAPGTTPTPPVVHMQKTRPRGFCTCKSWRWNSCPPKRKRFGPQFSTFGVEVAFNRSNKKKGVSSCLPCFPIKRKQTTTVTSSSTSVSQCASILFQLFPCREFPTCSS